MVKVDIGCGMRKLEDNIGIDIRNFPGVDYVLDIQKDPLPFEDNSVDEMKAIHILEHIYPEGLFFFMDEAFRVMKPKGFFHVEVPIFGTRAWLIHPDHKIHWNQDMVGFFMPPGNSEHKDPHGYLNGFWHVDFLKHDNPETLEFDLFPNKPGIERFKYVEIQK